MDYYKELMESIDRLINEKKYDDAKSLIINELNLRYVPRDIEDKLNEYLSEIKTSTIAYNSLTDDDINAYLSSNEEKQLLAVDELSRRNLRDYIDVCDSYLKGDGFINAKALLIDSLIRQEINYDFTYVNKCSLIKFNPKDLKIIEETDGFCKAMDLINEYYMKDPSKARIGSELVYKEALLSLPNQIDGDIVSEKIIKYIDDAFSAK